MNYSIISNRDTLHKKSTFCTDTKTGVIFLTKYIDEMLEKLYAKLHNLEKDCRRIKKLIKELEKIKGGEYFDGL